MFPRICTGLLALLIMMGCSGGGQSGLTTGEPPPVDTDTTAPLVGQALPAPALANLAVPRTVAELIQEAAEAPVPDGVDPGLFEELRAELIRVISARQTAVAGRPSHDPTGHPGERSVSFTPYGAINGIKDLYVSGEGPYYLTWTYQNRGDYDLNGMVNVSDLTPIGVYYGMTSSDPVWYKAAAADGDGNGMITVSDITPIGQYFGGMIIGYQVWGTDDPAGEWSHIGNATVEVNLRKNPLHTRLVIKFDSLDNTYYSLWPYDNSEDEGSWSNIATLGLKEVRRIIHLENIWDASS